VATPLIIRHRLLSIALLGLVTSALSLFALYRAVSTTGAVRRQRARDVVMAEAERLARLPPTAGSLAEPPSTTYLGLRSGWALGPAELAVTPGLDTDPASSEAPAPASSSMERMKSPM